MARIGNIDYHPRSLRLRVSKPAGDQPAWSVTIDGIDNKSWTGRSEQEAISQARKGAEKLFEQRAQTHEPEWMAREREIGSGIPARVDAPVDPS